MPLPTSIADLNTDASTNGPDGATEPVSVMDDYLRVLGSFIAQLRDKNAAQDATLSAVNTSIAALQTAIGTTSQPQQEIPQGANWNALTTQGVYRVVPTSLGTNYPPNAPQYGVLTINRSQFGDVVQTYTPHTSDIPSIRVLFNSPPAWSAWTDVSQVFQAGAKLAAAIELGQSLTGDRVSYVDFHSDATYSDYSARIARMGGPNGELALSSRGTGGIRLFSEESGPVSMGSGTSTHWEMSGAGVFRNPTNTQPAFFALDSQPAGNNATCVGYTSAEQNGTGFSTGTGMFVAPIAGWYSFSAECAINGNDAIRAVQIVRIRNASALTLSVGEFATQGGNDIRYQHLNVSRVKLQAGDQVFVQAQAGDNGGSTIVCQRFSGGLEH